MTIPPIASAPWLQRAETQAVLAALRAGGFPARVVGGAVRNELMGEPVADIDIATPLLPEETIRLARAAGFGVVPTGLAHGTVTIVANHVPYEVTTLRVDVETDGRHAEVAFTDDWVADARRRDFTMNALYADATGEVHDPVGGYRDVMARRVRFIGNAHERIREDYLRILRFFRFFAAYGAGDSPDADGLAACIAEEAGLERIAAERLRVELLKLVVGANAVPALLALSQSGILGRITGLVAAPAVLGRLAAIAPNAREPILALAASLVATDADAQRLAHRLRLSGDEARAAREIAAAMRADLPLGDDLAAHRLLYNHGPERFRRHVLTAWASGAWDADDRQLRHLLAVPERWTPPKVPLDGRTLMVRGIKPGPRLGRILKAFTAWWVAADFPDEAQRIEQAIDDAIRITPEEP